jgi:hypothetical protein
MKSTQQAAEEKSDRVGVAANTFGSDDETLLGVLEVPQKEIDGDADGGNSRAFCRRFKDPTPTKL